MNTIKKFDKRLINDVLQPRVIEALRAVAEEHGLTVRGAGGQFSETGWTTKIEFAVKNAETGVGGPDADAFKQLAAVYGLKSSDLGRTFRSGGLTHTIVGCKPRAHKRPIITVASDGNRYTWPVETVKLHLERSANAA